MIDRGVPNGEDWPDGVREALGAWEQGDLVADPPFFYFADPRYAVWEATRQYTETSTEPEIILPDEGLCPPYAIVTTQTCDVGEEDSDRPLRPWVQLAPVYAVKDWSRKKLARGGPRYWLLIPELAGPKPYVADLRIEMPVEKGWLAQQDRVLAFADETSKRAVGERLKLLRSRHAFGREVNQLVKAIWEFLNDVGDDEVAEALANGIEEVGLHLDSYLYPTRAQVVFMTTTGVDDAARDRLDVWHDVTAVRMHEAGITMQRHDVRALTEFSAADYRKLAIVWRR